MLKEGRKYSRLRNQIIRVLNDGERSVWDVIQNLDTHLSDSLKIIEDMIKREEIYVSGYKIGLDKRTNNCKYDIRCGCCDGRGVIINNFGDFYKEYLKLVESRPEPIEDYDQGYISPEDVMRRVAFIYERGDLEGSRIMLLGDDDLCSLALATTEMPEKIVVLEIDDRLVKYINRVAESNGYKVEARTYDAREELPEDIRKSFDVFITDPVETIPGIRLFLSRAVSSLKEEGDAGYFGLTLQESSLAKWKMIEEMILKMNFVITDILRNFSVYPNENNISRSLENYIIFREIERILGMKSFPDVEFYKSSLIRIEAVGEPVPLTVGYVDLSRDMYVDDEAWVTAMATKEV